MNSVNPLESSPKIASFRRPPYRALLETVEYRIGGISAIKEDFSSPREWPEHLVHLPWLRTTPTALYELNVHNATSSIRWQILNALISLNALMALMALLAVSALMSRDSVLARAFD